ncbi:pickpocket protein 28-like [Neocloeon triangulifer]|uniref:pickpocket protein 28-like n=1 Tax=Neocloeon triangulifer TaxID=2078957 RepID=UPI00286ECC8B|nr:pickpocket protein 28-like [Neocloeon triangulifer]
MQARGRKIQAAATAVSRWSNRNLDVPSFTNLQPFAPAVRRGLPSALSGLSSADLDHDNWDLKIHASQFCEKTSLHGLQYLGEDKRHWLERVFWMVAFVTAIAGAFTLITQLYRKWDQNPVIVSFSTSSTGITDIPFPAFTICNMNNIRKTVAKRILQRKGFAPEVQMEKNLLEDLCSVDEPPPAPPSSLASNDKDATTTAAPTTPAQRSPPTWAAVKQFMIKGAQPCHEMLIACAWMSAIRNCTNLFNTALTDDGLCCSFNKVPRELLYRNPKDLSDLNLTFPFPSVDWTPEEGYPKNAEHDALPWRPIGAGKHLGLTVVLDNEVDEYYCSSTASVGFKMLLHSPVETPKLSSFGFSIRPATENYITVQPQVRRSTKPVAKIPLRKRHCYFAFERRLRFYRTYTKHNCIQECESNFTLSICGCVLYFMPKDQNTRICGKRDEKCASDARATMEVKLYDESENGTTTEKPSCKCLPGCSEITYQSKITSSRLSDTFNATLRFPPLADKKINISYFKENYAIVHLFFTETEVATYQMDEIFGFADFLGSTGGLLGLFLGFSILSVVEVLYFLTLRLMCSWRRYHPGVSPTSSARIPRRHEPQDLPFVFVQ